MSASKRKRLPMTRSGTTYKIGIGDCTVYVTVNVDEEGIERELFVKADSGYQGWCDILAETASLYLQSGGTMKELLRHWRGHRFDPQQLGVGSSIPDSIARVIGKKNEDKVQHNNTEE